MNAPCCQRAAQRDEFLAICRELVAVKQAREEISRRKQRRACSISRNPAEVREVKRLHEECKAREYRAWNAALSALARSAA